MANIKSPNQNFIDKAIDYIAPGWSRDRKLARLETSYLNTIEPLETSNRTNRPHASKTSRMEDIINANDRKTMRSLVRLGSYENPILRGMLDRMVNNVIPSGGIKPNAITEDEQFNKDAEDYYMTRSEAGKCEITGRYDHEVCQRVALFGVLASGDFGAIKTNQRTQQLIESERIASPRIYSKYEGTYLHQGVRINDNGRPLTYYIGAYDRYGNIQENKYRGVPARDFHFMFHPERVEQYRGTSAFLSSLQNLRDVHDILKYEKFSQKMAACVSWKIKPAQSSKGIGLPFPTKDTKTGTDGKNISIKEMYPGIILDLAKMNAEDVTMTDNNRTGDNFEKMIELLARLAGCGVGLPIELVLLDFHRGNMSSVRAVMLEARKVFYQHYGIVKRYADWDYRIKISQGVKDGILKPPSKIANNYWLAEWTEPTWNWLDPLKEIAAEGMAIAFGLKTHQEVAKQRNRDWANIAEQLGKEYKEYVKEGVPVVIGDPGSKTIQEIINMPEEDSKAINKDN